MKSTILPALMVTSAILLPTAAAAEIGLSAAESIASVELLEGWREPDGRHIAAVRLTLAEGWKTYWRAPGDGGLPTRLQWHLSDNLEDLQILWPRPMVFDDGTMRSLGYENEVVLPLELTPETSGDITLNARLNFGVCKEVCVPASVDLRHVLEQGVTSDVDPIRAALRASPLSEDHAAIDHVSCTMQPMENGHQLTIDLQADIIGSDRAMVVETSDPDIWVSRTELVSDGDHWHGVTHLFDSRNTPATPALSDLRITLLSNESAVDIHGCSHP